MKIYIKSTQSIFAGTRYDKQAAKILVDSGIFNEEQANAIIDGLFTKTFTLSFTLLIGLKNILKVSQECVSKKDTAQHRA